MVKKTSSIGSSGSKDKATKPAAGLHPTQMAGAVRDSAQHIWLAGMGAFSKAQAEGGKVFEALVREGQNLQRKTQGLAEDRISEVTGKMTAMADTVTAKAGQNWDKLESIFETRTAKAMTKLGVPTAKDIDALVQRVDELAAAVARLSKATTVGKSAARKSPASKAVAAKPMAKKAVAKKPVAAKARGTRKTARAV
jgi:poly(hydroxyalkanoate) granule-associated protein